MRLRRRAPGRATFAVIGPQQPGRAKRAGDIALGIGHVGAHASAIFFIDHRGQSDGCAIAPTHEKFSRRQSLLPFFNTARFHLGGVGVVDPYTAGKRLPEPGGRMHLDGIAVDYTLNHRRDGPFQRFGRDAHRRRGADSSLIGPGPHNENRRDKRGDTPGAKFGKWGE